VTFRTLCGTGGTCLGAQQASKQRKRLSLETLLGTAELTIPLANFIDATERFKPCENSNC